MLEDRYSKNPFLNQYLGHVSLASLTVPAGGDALRAGWQCLAECANLRVGCCLPVLSQCCQACWRGLGRAAGGDTAGVHSGGACGRCWVMGLPAGGTDATR